MPKYRLQTDGTILWPKACAECGAPASAQVISRCSVVTKVGYFVVFVRTTHLKAALSYPVCGRHSLTARIASWLSSRNLITLTVGALWVLSAYGTIAALYRVIIRNDASSLGSLSLCGAVFTIGLGAVLLIHRYTPVRLVGATPDNFTIAIRRSEYADEFVKLNVHSKVAEIPWWKD